MSKKTVHTGSETITFDTDTHTIDENTGLPVEIAEIVKPTIATISYAYERELKYNYPSDCVTPWDRQKFRRKMRRQIERANNPKQQREKLSYEEKELRAKERRQNRRAKQKMERQAINKILDKFTPEEIAEMLNS